MVGHGVTLAEGRVRNLAGSCVRAKTMAGFALGPVVAAVLGLLTFPLLAWVFSPEDLGRYNVFTVTISFAGIFLTLGLDQAYVREYHETPDKSRLMRLCLLPALAATIAALTIALAFSTTLSTWLFGSDREIYVVLIAAAIVGSLLGRFLSLILRMQERGMAFSLTQVIPKFVMLAVIFIISVSDVEASFLVLASVNVVSIMSILVVYAWSTRMDWRSSRDAADPPSLVPLLKYGLPLTMAGLAYWGLTATSSISLRVFSSYRELGIYTIAVSAGGIVFILQNIFSTIWAPIVYRWSADGEAVARVDGMARLGAFLASGLAALVGMFSWLLSYILPDAYAVVEYMIVCAVLPPIFYGLSEITGIGLNLQRRTGLALLATVVAFVANIAMSLALVHYLDAAGAAIANALAFGVYFVVLTEASAHTWHKAPRGRVYVSLLSTLVLACIHASAGPLLAFSPSWLWVAMFLGVLAMWPHERAQCLALLRHRLSTVRDKASV